MEKNDDENWFRLDLFRIFYNDTQDFFCGNLEKRMVRRNLINIMYLITATMPMVCDWKFDIFLMHTMTLKSLSSIR